MDRNYWILAGAAAIFAVVVLVQREPAGDASASMQDAASRAKTTAVSLMGTQAQRQQAAAETEAQARSQPQAQPQQPQATPAPAPAQTAAASPPPAETTGASPTKISADDFVRKVAISDLFEIESSRLAKGRLDTPGKNFADHMVLAHQKTTSELKGLSGGAKFKGNLPTALDDEHRQKLDQLSTLNDKEFEDRYRAMQVQAHRDAIELFTAYSQNGDNQDLKQWASATLPDLKDHLAMAESIK